MTQRQLLAIGLDKFAPGKEGLYEVETIFNDLTPAEQVGLIGMIEVLKHDFLKELKRGPMGEKEHG